MEKVSDGPKKMLIWHQTFHDTQFVHTCKHKWKETCLRSERIHISEEKNVKSSSQQQSIHFIQFSYASISAANNNGQSSNARRTWNKTKWKVIDLRYSVLYIYTVTLALPVLNAIVARTDGRTVSLSIINFKNLQKSLLAWGLWSFFFCTVLAKCALWREIDR